MMKMIVEMTEARRRNPLQPQMRILREMEHHRKKRKKERVLKGLLPWQPMKNQKCTRDRKFKRVNLRNSVKAYSQ